MIMTVLLNKQQYKSWISRFLSYRNRSGLLALLVFIFIAILLLSPLFTTHSPYTQNLSERLQPPMWMEGGTVEHPLGTDPLGRDILSRLLYGGRISLLVGTSSMLLGAILGTTIALVATFSGGKIDLFCVLLADFQLSLPFILIALTVITFTGPNILVLILLLGLTSWVIYYRLVRSRVLSIREQPYVEASVALGASNARILIKHILPNAIGPAITIAPLETGRRIAMEASLSFLGLGIPPPYPSWGSMVADGRAYLEIGWWVSVIPGIAIIFLVFGLSLVGEWVAEKTDTQIRS